MNGEENPPSGTSELATRVVPHTIFDGLSESAAELAAASRSASTVRNYRRAWETFCAWCEPRGLVPLPAKPETVCAFVADRSAEKSISTVRQDLAAIRAVHLFANMASPTSSAQVSAVVSGASRKHGVRPVAKDATMAADIRAMCDAVPPGPTRLRDRALLLVGFAGAFRRSELVAVDVEHLTFSGGGVAVLIPRSKTDQMGRGEEKFLTSTGTAHCPVSALRLLLGELAQRSVRTGPVFRNPFRKSLPRISAGTVAELVKRYALAVGLDPARYAGHSLRAGFVTEAAAQGVPLDEIQAVTAHRRVDTLLRYVRRGEGRRAGTTRKIGL